MILKFLSSGNFYNYCRGRATGVDCNQSLTLTDRSKSVHQPFGIVVDGIWKE
jgi:hypothetical protein